MDESMSGRYSPERRLDIKGIPVAIVDPHNEVFPFWMEVKNGPALLIHIDNHSDMDFGAKTFGQAIKKITGHKLLILTIMQKNVYVLIISLELQLIKERWTAYIGMIQEKILLEYMDELRMGN